MNKQSFNKLLNASLIEEMPMRNLGPGQELYLSKGVKDQINAASAEKDTEKQPINEILPPDFQAMLASTRYRNLVSEMEGIFGATPPWASVMTQCMKAMGAIQKIELPKKKALEKLAIDTVLSFREWKIIKEDVDKGYIKITAEIKTPNFEASMKEFEEKLKEDEPEEIAEAEADTFDLILDESKLKRNLANYITQGQAAVGFNTYQLIKDKLNQIDPNLYDLYKYFVIGGLVNYFAGPLNLVNKSSAIGETKIDYEEGDDNEGEEGEKSGKAAGYYHIKASGANFVLVVHEVIKGLYDYLAVDVGPNQLEDIQDERLHTNIGPGIAKMFWDRFITQAEGGVEDLQYFPLVLRVLYGCDPDVAEVGSLDLKEMLQDKPRALKMLHDIIVRVKEDYLSDSENENRSTGNSEFNSEFNSDSNSDDDDTGDDWKNG